MLRKLKKELLKGLWLALFSSMFLSSCAWWEKQKKLSHEISGKECSIGNAPFIVGQVTKAPNDEAVTIVHGADGLPQQFILNLRTCLKDALRQDSPIQNISFDIEYYKSDEDRRNKNKTKVQVISDSQGCIQWQEVYQYQYKVKPVWIGLERTIKRDRGPYPGGEVVAMAVNPWLSENDEDNSLPYILDRRCEYDGRHLVIREDKNYKLDGLAYLKETKSEERPMLWASTVSIQTREGGFSKRNDKKEVENSPEDIKRLLSKYQTLCKAGRSEGERDSCYERHIEMEFYVPLALRSLDMSNSLSHKALQGGIYDVEAQLIISPKGDKGNYAVYNNEKCKISALRLSQTNKSLSFTCQFAFSYFTENAIYSVVLLVKPSKNTGHPFRAFEGVYTINLNFDHKKAEFSVDTGNDEKYKRALDKDLDLNIIESLNIESVEKIFSNRGDSEQTAEQDALSDIKIKGLDFYPLHLDGEGDYKLSHIESGEKCEDRENVVQRTAVFVGKVCLTDVLHSQKLNQTRFRVFLEWPEKEKCEGADCKGSRMEELYFSSNKSENLLHHYTADGKSCISIPVAIKHNMYDKQRYFEVQVHVLSEQLNLYGKVRLALSPWQRAFQAFQEASKLPEKTIRFDTKNVEPPELVINQFRSINLFPSYGLDKLLNIHLFHRVYLLFQPFIRRPDNLSLGLQHRARELLRDGLYLVRVLILRNPQETGAWDRVETADKQNQTRKQNVVDTRISLKGAEYITHTDSVIYAKANFINLYMPLYLSTKQFYYIGSRNFIAVEVYPADPQKIAYNKVNDNCEVDVKKSSWRPFTEDDLVNFPYVGAFNIQNWMNWNILQPVRDVDTDQIIDKSDLGRKYRHFSLSSQTEPQAKQKNLNPFLGCTEELTAGQSDQIQQALTGHKAGRVFQGAGSSSALNDPSFAEKSLCVRGIPSQPGPALEAYKKEEERHHISNVLGSFAERNSLKTIQLSEKSGQTFIQDLQSSFHEYMFSDNTDSDHYSEISDFLNQLDETDRNLLRLKFFRFCPSIGYRVRSKASIGMKCRRIILKAYLQNMKEIAEDQNILEMLLTQSGELVSPDEKRKFGEQFGQWCEASSSHRNSSECHQLVKDYTLKAIDYSIGENFFPRHRGFKHKTPDSFAEDLLYRYKFEEKILSFFSSSEKMDLFERSKSCGFFRGLFKIFGRKFERCYFDHLKEIYSEKEDLLDSEMQNEIVNHFRENARILSNREHLKEIIRSNSDKNYDLLKDIIEEPVENQESPEEGLMNLIQEGVKNSNKYSPNIISFAKSLCVFWFDSYIKDYLGKDQKLSAYMDYISKFDYRQVLESDFMPYKEKQSFLPRFIDQMLSENQGDVSTQCYSQYAQCLLSDHCQNRAVNKSKEAFCPDLRQVQDESCLNILKEKCVKDPDHGLCRNRCLREPHSPGCSGENLCNASVRDFCYTNKDQELCEKYDNRCFTNYLPCMKEADSSLFDTQNILNYQPGSSFAPLKTCLKNPYEFFKFENKMMVYELSEQNPKYEGGFLQSFGTAANYSIGSYMNWTSQRGRSLNAMAKAGLPSELMKKMTLGILSADFSASQSIGTNESNSGRRAVDIRMGESLYLTVGKANINVGVKKFQKCLVIKPRPNAFTARLSSGEPELYKGVWREGIEAQNFKKIMLSRPGLILCNPLENRNEADVERITESYYYVSHQLNANDSEFLNLYDLANRPFLLILRGRGEFVKLYHLLNMGIEGDNGRIEQNNQINKLPENMFTDYPFPIEEAIGLSLSVREFNETGFHPGVYSYPDSSDENMDVWFENKGRSWETFILNPLTHYNLFGVPKPPKTTVPVQR